MGFKKAIGGKKNVIPKPKVTIQARHPYEYRLEKALIFLKAISYNKQKSFLFNKNSETNPSYPSKNPQQIAMGQVKLKNFKQKE